MVRNMDDIQGYYRPDKYYADASSRPRMTMAEYMAIRNPEDVRNLEKKYGYSEDEGSFVIGGSEGINNTYAGRYPMYPKGIQDELVAKWNWASDVIEAGKSKGGGWDGIDYRIWSQIQQSEYPAEADIHRAAVDFADYGRANGMPMGISYYGYGYPEVKPGAYQYAKRYNGDLAAYDRDIQQSRAFRKRAMENMAEMAEAERKQALQEKYNRMMAGMPQD